MGRERISLSKRIKDSVKSAVSFINNFEQTAADLAIEKEYDYVICGHIHQPVIKTISNKDGSVTYLNSGDWIENLTALEYNNGSWSIYYYHEDLVAQNTLIPEVNTNMKSSELFKDLIKEFNISAST